MKYTLTVNNLTSRVQELLKLIRTNKEMELEEDNSIFDLSDTYKMELDNRLVKHLSGESKSFSWQEVKERAQSSK